MEHIFQTMIDFVSEDFSSDFSLLVIASLNDMMSRRNKVKWFEMLGASMYNNISFT